MLKSGQSKTPAPRRRHQLAIFFAVVVKEPPLPTPAGVAAGACAGSDSGDQRAKYAKPIALGRRVVQAIP